jgi:hypothetical protein
MFLIYQYNIWINLKNNPMNIKVRKMLFKHCNQHFTMLKNIVWSLFKHYLSIVNLVPNCHISFLGTI